MSLRQSPNLTPALLSAKSRYQGSGARCQERALHSQSRWFLLCGNAAAIRKGRVPGARKDSIETGRGKGEKILKCDARSRNIIENTRHSDIMSCFLTDILGNLTRF